jgi:glycosyltransferase involved in cell wall biosynthesis
LELQLNPELDRPQLSIIFLVEMGDSTEAGGGEQGDRDSPSIPSTLAEANSCTIAALLAQTDPDWQLLVVGEERLTRVYAEQVGDRARVIPIDASRSKAEAYNEAVKLVQTPWLMCLEAGATWSADWIAGHRAMWQRDQTVQAVYGAVRVTDRDGVCMWRTPSPEESPIEPPIKPAAIDACVRPEPVNSELAKLLVWNHCGSIANVSVRTEAWRQVGGLAEDLPLEWSVWELATRLTQLGSVRPVSSVTGKTSGDRAACCTYAYRHNPDITATRCEPWLDCLFADRGDPYRRLRSRSRRNLLRWHGFHAITSGQPNCATWVQALVTHDRSISGQTDLLDALAWRLEASSNPNPAADQLLAICAAGMTSAEWAASVDRLFGSLLDRLELEPFPLISVVIPVFNGATTIAMTIQSVLAQTCQDFEILVIDDGSIDDTLGYLDAIQDDRLWVYSFENAGVSTSRNRGLQLAIGRYCTFLDADDCWTPEKLQRQCQALEASREWPSGGAAVAYSWVDYIDAQGDPLRPGSHLTVNGDALAHLLLMNFLENGSNLLVKTRVARQVGGFDPAMTPAEDWDYALRLAWAAHFVCVPQAQVLYRLLPLSASAQVSKTESSCCLVLDRAFARIPQALHYLRPYSFANLYRYLTYRTLASSWNPDRCRQALTYIQNIIDLDPLVQPETYQTLIRACLTYIHLPTPAANRLYPEDQCDFSAMFQETKSSPYPLVSVIIPAYNGANTIVETIASVQAQTLRDWEIILIDDGSTDETAAIVEAIGDPRIQVYRYPNAGQGESRNRGACHATGEFFAFLDADDLWSSDKLERMVEAIGDNPKAAVAYSWIDHIDEDGRFMARGCDYTRRGYVYDKLLLSDFIAGGSNLMLWRGAFGMVGGFNPDFPPAEDRDMWLRLAEKFHFVAIEAPLLKYRQVPQSQSANVTRMERSQRRVIEAAFDRAPDNFPFTKLPELLPYYKHQVLANTYKYLTFKQLDAPVNQASARIALQLFQVVLDNEPTLIQQHRRFIIKLWLRIWLATVLPPPIMARVFRRFRTFHRLHRDLLGYTRMSLRDLLPEDLRRRYEKLTGG